MEPLNIPYIKNRIQTAHQRFVDTVGAIPDKITADHQLILNRMATRIETILKCFVEAKIINIISKGAQNGEGDRSCFVFKLTKIGFDRSVHVTTDGANINIKTIKYNPQSGLNFDEDVNIRDIDFETYDWVEFSDKLLHFIHQVIYSRKKSIETKLFDGR